MGFDGALFWPAFKDAGMLDVATARPTDAPPFDFDVGFKRPDQVVLDGMVHTTDYSIEYQAVDAQLRRGDIVAVDGIDYKVRQAPKANRDGRFIIALLEEIKP